MKHGKITLKNETVSEFPRYCVSRGLPLPAEWDVREPGEVSVRTEDGTELPSAGTVLQRRADGSIEWLLTDLLVDLGPTEERTVHIEHVPNGTEPVENAVEVVESDDGVSMRNGIVELVIARRGSLITSLSVHGRRIVGPHDRVDLETVDPNGKVYRASVSDGYEITVEHATRLRATVLVEGTHTARDTSTLLDFALRFTVTAGRADVTMTHTFFVREPSEGMIRVKAVRLVMPTRMPPDSTKLLHQAHHGRTWWPRGVEIAENVEVVASSCSELNDAFAQYEQCKPGTLFLRNFDSLHEDRSEYPFYIPPDGGPKFRAEYLTGGVRQVYPWVGWRSDDVTLVFGVRWWAALHPKSVAIDENVLTFSVWPEWAPLMKVVQGVSKSHTFWLGAAPGALSVDAAEKVALQWEIKGLTPLAVEIDPDWPRFCRVLDCHEFVRYQPEKYGRLEERLGHVVPGEPARFTYARHKPNGMFNFGDAAPDNPAEPSFTNNEDDLRSLAPLLEYLRTGRAHCMDFAEEAVNHYMEVDYCEFSTQPRKHGGLIPHTHKHFIGEVYSSHQWVEGILAYYYLTGDERARKVVVSVADNHVWWTEHLLDQVCCDGREAGIPLVNMSAAYRLTGDERYVRACHTIIDNFHKRWMRERGCFEYPYPQGAMLMWTKDYGNWSTYYGLYRLWEATGDEEVRELLVTLLQERMAPERFSVDDSRGMDFFAVWAYIRLTADETVVEKLRRPIDNFLEKGGHPMRRLHFLGYMDERGDERLHLGEAH